MFCKTKYATERGRESIAKIIERKLFLKVNKEKTVVSYIKGMKYLGYSFYVHKDDCQLTVHPKSREKVTSRLKELTSRSNGWGYAIRKQKLAEYERGWVGYYRLANRNASLKRPTSGFAAAFACRYGRLGRNKAIHACWIHTSNGIQSRN